MLNCDSSPAVHSLVVEPAHVCSGLWAPNVVFLANANVVINFLLFSPLLVFFPLPVKLRHSMSSEVSRQLVCVGTY